MKRIWVVLLTALLGIGAMGVLPSCMSPKTYANCTEMQKTYKGGVSRKGAVDKRTDGSKAKYKPYVNDSLYNANQSKLDRDRDGIACEQ